MLFAIGPAPDEAEIGRIVDLAVEVFLAAYDSERVKAAKDS
ncbi:TetR/AcrR family transcriptional regulator C-terminal domain-containing protein [Breoghania sp.]